MSVDGYLDDASDTRLMLSNDDDLDRVDEVRAGVDAILVGANTIRRDDPRLLVRSAARRAARIHSGLPPNPIKVTLCTTGDLDPGAAFFTKGEADKLVYTTSGAAGGLRARLGAAAEVVDMGGSVPLPAVLADLARRAVRHLLVEGGGDVHTRFLTAGLVDELHLAIAPLFVGDAAAARFVRPGAFPQDPAHRMILTDVRRVGDMALLRYLPRGTA